jgi:hypothetical protein
MTQTEQGLDLFLTSGLSSTATAATEGPADPGGRPGRSYCAARALSLTPHMCRRGLAALFFGHGPAAVSVIFFCICSCASYLKPAEDGPSRAG